MANPIYFLIVKYLFFIVAFGIAFAMIFSQSLESLGVNAFTYLFVIFGITVLTDMIANFSSGVFSFASSIFIIAACLITLAAAIIFTTTITKINATFLENGKPLEFSKSVRYDITKIETLFAVMVIIIIFGVMTLSKSSLFETVYQFFSEQIIHITNPNELGNNLIKTPSRGAILIALVCFGLLMRLYRKTITDTESKPNTAEHDFKESIRSTGQLSIAMIVYGVIYFIFAVLSIIFSTTMYMPNVSMYLNGILAFVLSGLFIYLMTKYLASGSMAIAAYIFIAIIGALNLWILISFLGKLGVPKLSGFIGMLGNDDTYRLINQTLVILIFVFITAISLYYYTLLKDVTEYTNLYVAFISFAAFFIFINLFSTKAVYNILNLFIFRAIPVLAVAVSIYLLVLTNYSAPLWRNKLTQ